MRLSWDFAHLLLFGYVFGSSIQLPGGNYRAYLMSGLLAQSTLFCSAAVAENGFGAPRLATAAPGDHHAGNERDTARCDGATRRPKEIMSAAVINNQRTFSSAGSGSC